MHDERTYERTHPTSATGRTGPLANSPATDPHHLLAQVPLTVSPFLSLPAATTLPYTYKQLPSTLPPSVVDPHSQSSPASAAAPAAVAAAAAAASNDTSPAPKPAYVTSSTGHAAHPDDIIASCRALQAHLLKLQEDARDAVRRWEDGIRERELAEKRRVAPGWLDEEVRLLVPEKVGTGGSAASSSLLSAMGNVGPVAVQRDPEMEKRNREGEELDRAFGALGLR